ncbi:MAG: peptidoglycan DD-metalloendopeptidase family protein [Campylobacterota bacterium]|nr:peptidoglycan DD-metalloendopeptidase family protein [Campylobacterota bacterium]
MRFLSVLFLLSLTLTCNAKTSIDTKILNTTSRINSFDKSNKMIHVDMAKNAKSILKQNRAILKQQRDLKALQHELATKEKLYKQEKQELSLLQNSQNDLQGTQNEIEQQLAFAIAKNASLSLLLDDERARNAESLITEEALKLIASQTQETIKNLESSYSGNNEVILSLQSRIQDLRTSIAAIDKKEHELSLAVKANKKSLKKLNAKTVAYERSLSKLLKEQKALKKTLSRLNIVKKEEIKEKKEAAKRKRLAQEQAKKDKLQAKEAQENYLVSSKNLPKVKQVGSSYQKIKTKRYRGKKTISPLEQYSVSKKFGPYTDPIYNIKIFNESISLKPKSSNAKVKNILNGKVVMAQEMAMLDNVVIVEHQNGLHTIYAHLDKIAPTIKKGKKIRKGSIIGRVNDELMLEVTQKNYHINPLQLIN